MVEGWIGRRGIHAAAAEFEKGPHKYIVATGGLASGRWEEESTSHAKMAAAEMIRSGVPKDKRIVTTASDAKGQRTYESLLAPLSNFFCRCKTLVHCHEIFPSNSIFRSVGRTRRS